jgi:hypothetical protein
MTESTLVKKTVIVAAPIKVFVYAWLHLDVPADMTDEQITQLAIAQSRNREVEFDLPGDCWDKNEAKEAELVVVSIDENDDDDDEELLNLEPSSRYVS